MVQITKHLLDAFMACCVGRRDDYAVQGPDGRYHRARHALTYEAIFQHLQGVHTLGSYVINEHGLCRFAVFDSDVSSGLVDLLQVQTHLRGAGVPSYLEMSRRGAHLRVFLSEPVPPALVRQWLLPYCPAGVEFYPKQDGLSASVPFGSLVRLPLGIHRVTGERYPFVVYRGEQFVPLAASMGDMLRLFASVHRAVAPVAVPSLVASSVQTSNQHNIPFNSSSIEKSDTSATTIRAWCMQQDAYAVIGRYVALDKKGMGCCPFGWHHVSGVDTHPSFWVYRPTSPDICCWYCHTWKQGGSLFDFLRYYYGLDARELWSHIRAGGHF
jgi:hypothetical protein